MKLLTVLAVALAVAQPCTAGAASPTSIALDAERLPPKYAGAPFVPVYKRYVMFKPRGEFEAAAAWEARLAAVGDTQVSFVVPSDATYDIDAGRLSLTVLGDDAETTSGYCTNKDRVRGRPYRASNAYGRSAMVQPVSVYSYCIWDSSSAGGQKTFSVLLDPAAARSAKPFVRLLVAFAPAPPLDQAPVLDQSRNGVRANGADYSGATVDAPLEETFLSFTLAGSIRYWLVFDSRDGKVLGRYTAEMQQLTLDEAIAVVNPDPNAVCQKQASCLQEGKCTAAGGDCVASGSDCENKPPCRKQGRCVAAYGECVKAEQ